MPESYLLDTSLAVDLPDDDFPLNPSQGISASAGCCGPGRELATGIDWRLQRPCETQFRRRRSAGTNTRTAHSS